MKPGNELNAFMQDGQFYLNPINSGSLSGLTFAVKDLFDIAGYVTGAGNPTWKKTHPPAIETAPAVISLLEAGATFVGKTITDEMGFSLDGENVHYETPVNPRCPNRIPGGSSSGSASAVAGGIVDFSLGTDTAGSVRIPASYCGIYGFRPTYGVIPLKGVHLLAKNFDVVGWFARSSDILSKVGYVLLKTDEIKPNVTRFVFAQDLFNEISQETSNLLISIKEKLENIAPIQEVQLAKPGISQWIEVLQTIQWWELNQTHGDWISEHLESFGEEIRGRLSKITSITELIVNHNYNERKNLIYYINRLLPKNTIAVLPTAPDIPPLKGRSLNEVRAFRSNVLKFVSIATVAGLPEVTIPFAQKDGCPLGISLLGSRGDDALLLSVAKKLF